MSFVVGSVADQGSHASVPSSSAALGVHIYARAFNYAPAANQRQVVASNGIDWLIGNQ